jgi:hypothetical protein
MRGLVHLLQGGLKNLRQQQSVGTAREGGVLGALHLRRRHELHRLGDLGGVFDRLDAAANLANTFH